MDICNKKKLLVYRWGSLCEPLLCNALKALDIEYVELSQEIKNYHADAEFARALMEQIHVYGVEGVISYDYFPVISMICEINHIPYIAWIYDCPLYTLLSKTVTNSCNYIFCFDRIYAERLCAQGAVHCFHFPLAGNQDMAAFIGEHADFACDISFVGNLYNDEKNRLRQAKLSEYAAGYIEGLVRAQLLVYGYNFIEESIPENIAEEVIRECDLSLGEEYLWDGIQMTADAIGMEVSARERELVLQSVSARYPVHLYTSSEIPATLCNPRLQNMGYVDSQREAPLVFHNSKINLNITAKTIVSGIPQRVFDIMSCGGFCLTNYQPEIGEYFTDGVDLVMYYSVEDLLEKVSYYLNHDEERTQIAENGYKKVLECFEMRSRMQELLKIVFE